MCQAFHEVGLQRRHKAVEGILVLQRTRYGRGEQLGYGCVVPCSLVALGAELERSRPVCTPSEHQRGLTPQREGTLDKGTLTLHDLDADPRAGFAGREIAQRYAQPFSHDFRNQVFAARLLGMQAFVYVAGFDVIGLADRTVGLRAAFIHRAIERTRRGQSNLIAIQDFAELGFELCDGFAGIYLNHGSGFIQRYEVCRLHTLLHTLHTLCTRICTRFCLHLNH